MLKYFNSFNDVTKTRVLFFFVIAIAFLCFVPTLSNDLLMTWDDGTAVVENEHIRQISIETFRWAFTTFYLEEWLPLVWISFALDYAVWGLNPVGYHLTNNIIHALNAALFFLVSLALLKQYISRNPKSSVLTGDRIYYCSLLAALLFAIHPLRVQSVAWVGERKDVLSLFFGLLALLAYIRYTSREASVAAPIKKDFLRVPPVYWVACMFYCLSLFSKSMLVSLPLVLLVLDWFPLKRINRINLGRVFLEKTPFILGAGITSVILMNVHTVSKMSYDASNMLSRILIAFKSVIGYLWLMVWPVELSHFNLHPGNIQTIGFEYLLPIFIFIAITVCCVLSIKKWPVFTAVWMIYVITLIPVLGFVQVSSTGMSDRYTYVPGLAVALLVALGITTLVGKFAASQRVVNSIIAGTVIILSTSWYLTAYNIPFWKNDVTIWSRAIELQPHFSGRMYFERAEAYVERGEFDKALPDMSEAIAIAIRRGRPNMEELYFKRALIYSQLGETDRANADYNYALSLMPIKK